VRVPVALRARNGRVRRDGRHAESRGRPCVSLRAAAGSGARAA
jgi:hypothetical protein